MKNQLMHFIFIFLASFIFWSELPSQTNLYMDMSEIKTSEASAKTRSKANILIQWRDQRIVVLEHVQELETLENPQNVTLLTLQNCGLSQLPPILKRFTGLEILDLSHNHLICSSLEGFKAPKSLKTLYLNNNPALQDCITELSAAPASYQTIYQIKQVESQK